MWSCTYNKRAQNCLQTHIEEYGEMQIKMWLLVEAGWRVTFHISLKILGGIISYESTISLKKLKRKKKSYQKKLELVSTLW